MGKKVRPRKKVQRTAAARDRAKTRVLGRREPKRRRSGTEVSGAWLKREVEQAAADVKKWPEWMR